MSTANFEERPSHENDPTSGNLMYYGGTTAHHQSSEDQKQRPSAELKSCLEPQIVPLAQLPLKKIATSRRREKAKKEVTCASQNSDHVTPSRQERRKNSKTQSKNQRLIKAHQGERRVHQKDSLDVKYEDVMPEVRWGYPDECLKRVKKHKACNS